MRVYILQTAPALTALRRDLPDEVITDIMGKEVVVNSRFEYEREEYGIHETWALPPEACKVVEA